MIVCVLLPRFALAVAAGGREALAAGPVALAPEPGREQLIGEASAAAEAYGVRAGLRLGEALARCPTLRLVAPDPAGVADAWDAHARARWRASARRSSPGAPGIAWFDARRAAHAARRHARGRARRRARRALGGARRGSAPRPRASPRSPPPSRARARRAGGRADGRRGAAPPTSRRCPSRCCSMRPETAALPEALERFGIRTLGELATLPRAALADRFGAAGPLARDLAQGRDTPLVPRTRRRAAGGGARAARVGARASQLERALGLLIDRLLARRERRGRTLRAVVLSAALVEGGTWRARRDLPRGAGRPAADAARARPAAGRAAGAGRRPAPARRGLRPAGGRPALAAGRAGGDPRARACARRSARRARSPGRTPRCGSSPSIPTRACPSAASRSRRGIRDAAGRRAARRQPRGPRRSRAGEGGRPRRSTAARSRRCASPGWSRTAGGPTRPLRRRYWEVVTADGRDLVVFRDLEGGGASVHALSVRVGPVPDAASPRTRATAASAPIRRRRRRTHAATGRCPARRRGRAARASRRTRPSTGRSRAARAAARGSPRGRAAGRAAGPPATASGERAQARGRGQPACRAARRRPAPRAPGNAVAVERDQLLRRPARARDADLLAEHGPHGELPAAPRAGDADAGRAREQRDGRGSRPSARASAAGSWPRSNTRATTAGAASPAQTRTRAATRATRPCPRAGTRRPRPPRAPGSRACRARRARDPSRRARGAGRITRAVQHMLCTCSASGSSPGRSSS